MGASFSNFQVRTAAKAEVVAAAKSLVAAQAYVSNPKEGWVSLYDENCENQSEDEITRLAKGLSAKLQTVVFAFLVHDSDVFCYWLYENGNALDAFNSCPDYFGEVTPEERSSVSGNPQMLARFSRPGVEAEAVGKALQQFSTDRENSGSAEAPAFVFAEEQLRLFAVLIGVVPARATTGFSSFIEGDIDESIGAQNQFKLVKSKDYEKKFKRNQALFEAIRNRSVADVTALLSAGVDANARRSIGETALMVALSKGHLEIAKCLLEAGADIHAKFFGGTIIGYAVCSGSPDVVRFALSHGASASAVNGLGRTALIVALTASFQMFSTEIIELLVKAGADVNQRTDLQFIVPRKIERGTTPLIWAVRMKNLSATRKLLELGADLAAKDAQGKDAMTYAVEKLERTRTSLQNKEATAARGESMTRLLEAQAADLEAIIALLHKPTSPAK